MPTILKKTYVTAIPKCKFVGRCYGESDRSNGTFAEKWGEWFANGLFAPLEALADDTLPLEEKGACWGLCRCKKESDEYWTGMLLPENAAVPVGYESFPIPACDGIVNWVYGKEPDIYFHNCSEDMKKQGYLWEESPAGERLMGERYVCPRYTEPDETGNRVIDLVYFTNYRQA